MIRFLSQSRRLAGLLAAGVLGIAQLTVSLHASSPVAAARPADSNRIQEIQVELAWMGDPVTFRCPLHARVKGGRIELTGFVPSADARALAVRLAHDACDSPLRDSIGVQRKIDNTYAPVSQQELTGGVKLAVQETLGSQVSGVEIRMGTNGKIILGSKTLSWADRHALCARIRLVRGCSCVVNLPFDSGSAAPTAPVARPIPAVTAKPVSPAQPTVKQGSSKNAEVEQTSWASPYSGPAEPARPVASTDSKLKPAKKVKRTWSSPYGITKTAERPAPAPKAEPLTARDDSTTPPSTARVAHSTKPDSPVVSTEVASVAPMPAERQPPRGLFALLKRESPPRSKPTPVERVAIPDRPYVSIGTVVFQDDPVVLDPPSIKSASAPASGLREKMLSACGKSVKDVTIKARADKGTQVTVRVSSEKDIESVYTKALLLPEMQSPQVHLDFEIAP